MQFNPRALIPFGVTVVAAALVLKARAFGSDPIMRIALWIFFAAMSVVSVVKMIRGRHWHPYGQPDVVPGRMRRWILGESAKRPKSN